jgi:hypothetical protein
MIQSSYTYFNVLVCLLVAVVAVSIFGDVAPVHFEVVACQQKHAFRCCFPFEVFEAQLVPLDAINASVLFQRFVFPDFTTHLMLLYTWVSGR